MKKLSILFFLGITPTLIANHSLNDFYIMNEPVTVDYLMGKFDPSKNSNFEKISSKYTDKKNIYLRKEVYAAYKRMYAAAMESGISLQLLSATRNFDYQKEIWETKWNSLIEKELKKDPNAGELNCAKRILRYSAMPGASRHHWGTDIDMCSVENSFFKRTKGAKIYAWLQAHAHTYGFCQPYTPKDESRPSGYNEEKWHWSYQPSASVFTTTSGNLMKNELFDGFNGANTAIEIDVVNNYMLGICTQCK